MGEEKGRWWLGVVAVAVVGLVGCGQTSDLGTDLGEGAGSGSGGVGVSNTVSRPSDMAVGDIMPIQFSSSTSQDVSFSGVATGSKFILVVGSANSTGVGSSVQLSSDLSADQITKSVVVGHEAAQSESAVDPDFDMGPTEVLDSWLRAAEGDLASSEPAPLAASSLAKAMTDKSVAIGDVETFRVLSSLTSVSSYVEVHAALKCIGQNVNVYVDNDVSSDQLSSDDIANFCAAYDRIAGEEFAIYGAASDVNGNGKIDCLFSGRVNALGASGGGGGIVTGYFYAGDLYPRTATNQVTNFRDMVHLMVPDPSGRYGTPISKSFCMSNLCYAVFAHELQHAISYNQKVFVNGGSAEASWLNEAMSHFAEERFGYPFENPSRYALFLSSPSTTSVVTSSSPNLQERGAGYLFLRFLCEQSPDCDGFLRRLDSTVDTGVANLEQAFAGPEDFNQFSEFFGRWTVAVALTNRGVTTDSRYVYRSRTLHGDTGNWMGVLLSGDPQDNRGTTLTGVNLSTFNGFHSVDVGASAAKYYSMTTVPNTMTISGSANGGTFGMLIRTE